MAHKKGQGSSRNGRDSNAKYLGLKVGNGQSILAGTIILKQRGTKIHPGSNVKRANDDALFATKDGIVEFRNDNLSILTSSIFDASKMDKNKIDEILKQSENVLSQKDLDDQKKYLIDQKIDVLKSLSPN